MPNSESLSVDHRQRWEDDGGRRRGRGEGCKRKRDDERGYRGQRSEDR